MTFKATYLGSNGWVIEFADSKIVIDPWLMGDLVFPPGKWFFKGYLKEEIPTPTNVSLILLTQGLPDHCHLPSLKRFDRKTKIICPKSAYQSLKNIGFKSIEIMRPSDKITIGNIRIETTSGAPVPQTENGYIVEHKEGSFYIEPHGFFDKRIRPRKLDAVITPTKSLKLPILGSFVKGAEVIPELINAFDPKFILSSTIGGEAEYSGVLNNFISVDNPKQQLKCQLLDLMTLETVSI